jgi:hypothetical protein
MDTESSVASTARWRRGMIHPAARRRSCLRPSQGLARAHSGTRGARQMVAGLGLVVGGSKANHRARPAEGRKKKFRRYGHTSLRNRSYNYRL